MRFVLACCLALTFVACTTPTKIVTQPGQIAFKSDAIVVRINELQAAAIAANTSGGLDALTTKVVVEFSIAARTTLGALPDGWQITVKQAWAQARPKIVTTNSTLLLAVGAIDALIGAL